MQKKGILILVLVIGVVAGLYYWVAKDNSTLDQEVPNSERTFSYPADFTPEAQAIIETGLATNRELLEKNNKDIMAWIELGNFHNLVRDYESARIYWEYAAGLNPDNFVPFYNLGNLYYSETKDYALSEKNFTAAVAADPSQISVYRAFYDLYRFGFKDDVKAKAILRQGIAANPKTSADLQYLLDHYNEVQ